MSLKEAFRFMHTEFPYHLNLPKNAKAKAETTNCRFCSPDGVERGLQRQEDRCCDLCPGQGMFRAAGVIRTLAARGSIADTGFCCLLSGVYWDD